MNELIQQLAEQAKKDVPHGLAVDKWIETYNQLFAESIVKECIAICISNTLDDLDSNDKRGSSAKCAFDIKERFGVE